MALRMVLFAGVTGGFAAGVSAQQIPYDGNEYLFADETVAEEQDVPAAEPSIPSIDPNLGLPAAESIQEQPVAAASRVIPVRVNTVEPTIGADFAAPYGTGAALPARPYPLSYTNEARVGSYGYTPPAGSTLPGGGQLVEFDRQTWLAECRARLETHPETDRARVIGLLSGAVLGGVAGNRLAGGNRLGGTAVGAGLGGATGSMIGDIIDDRNDRSAPQDEGASCERYLDAYIARAQASPAPLTTVSGQQYFLVPVSVEVPQEVVYRTGTAE